MLAPDLPEVLNALWTRPLFAMQLDACPLIQVDGLPGRRADGAIYSLIEVL